MKPTIFFLIASFIGSALHLHAQNSSVTDEEALNLAHRIEAATNNGNPDELNRLLDISSLVEKISAKCKALEDPEFRRGFESSFRQSMASYGSKILASVKDGSYRLLREYDDKGTKHLFFRMFGTGGLNYHDFTLLKVKDSVRASDVYLYTVDDEISKTMAELVNSMMAKAETTGLSEDTRVFLKMTEYRDQKNYSAAREMYDKLDSKFQESKAIQVLYIDVCHRLDLALYEKALDHYVASFPEMASGYLMMIDLYYLEKKFDKGLAALDRLDKVVKQDPCLDLYRGNFYRLSDKKGEGLACYERLYKYDPVITINTLKLIAAYAESGKYEKGRSVIGEYKKTMAFRQEELQSLYSKYPDLK
jgi:hypothetical protein